MDGGDLYLEPEAAFGTAQRQARDAGYGGLVTPRTLQRVLAERHLLVSVESQRGKLTVRRTLEGQRRAVLHLDAQFFAAVVGPTGPLGPLYEGSEDAAESHHSIKRENDVDNRRGHSS